MLYGIKIEICAGSLMDIEIANKYSEVDRMEVNSHLEDGGLSIEHSDFLKVRQMTQKQLMCMVRQRPGDFIYTKKEEDAMYQEAEYFLAHGADGIVFGAQNENSEIDEIFTEKMIVLAHSYQKEVVFHKAFDETPDLFRSAEILSGLHCDRILTSAHEPDCYLGRKILAQLNQRYGDRIQILPGGGIHADNVWEILQEVGCSRFHMSLRASDPEQKLIDVLEAIRSAHFNPPHTLTGEDAEMMAEDQYEEQMEVQTDTHTHE